MKSQPIIQLLLLTLSVSLLACSNDGAQHAQSAIKMDTCQLADTTSFVKGNGDRCAIYAEASIEFPQQFKDKATTEQLQRLFAAFVLNAPDSLSLNDAMRAAVGNSLHQYDFVEQVTDEQWGDKPDDSQPLLKYNTNTTVSVKYNKNNIITFCKSEVVKKNDQVTSVTHRYYSFDLATMCYIDLHKMFRDEAMADVTQLLRQQLMEQNNVTSDDQLNELGYFNVDNLTVNRNFFFDDNGVTWSFLPSQLAVDAIGEPQIMLTYDKLQDFMCESSVIKRLD